MRLLLAEDETLQRRALGQLLEGFGYVVASVRNGAEAWQVLQEEDPPRLVLLDWYMPGVDGVDLCRRVKARPNTFPYTYTLLTTRGAGTETASRALAAGADDFVSKPLDPEELRARLGVGCRVLAYDDSVRTQRVVLQRYAAELEALAERRAQQLLHAERMATLGLLSAGMAHEISNPATVVSTSADIARRELLQLQAEAFGAPELSLALRGRLRAGSERALQALESIAHAVTRIGGLVRQLNVYSRRESAEGVVCSLDDRVTVAIGLAEPEVKRRGAHVRFEAGGSAYLSVRVAPRELEQVLVNLIVNAAHAVAESQRRDIYVWSESVGARARLIVEDAGPGIPPELLNRIWEPFFTTKPEGEGTGLGLSIARDIVESHGGTLTAENRGSGGVRFVIDLPQASEQSRPPPASSRP